MDSPLAKTLEILFEPGAVVELRTFKGNATYSGYFDDRTKLVEAAAKADKAGHDVYVTFNKLPRALIAKRHNRVDKVGGGGTTSDNDVERRSYIVVDFDPKRPSGISSTDEEKAASYKRAVDAREWLTVQGWPDPIFCDSGNGYHLIYPIDLPNDKASLALVAGVLEALDFKFSDAAVEIDLTMKNAARITKFYGVVAKKGDNLLERPHRQSKLLEAPTTRELVSKEQLAKVAGSKPEQPKRHPRMNTSAEFEDFDLGEWLEEHGIGVKRQGEWNGAYRYVLEECMNGHTDNAGYIIRWPEGNILSRCHHNSCTYEWADYWRHYDPDLYKRLSRDSHDTSDTNDTDFELPTAEPFPVDALPPSTRQFVREAAQAIGCPVDYIGGSVLAALSAAIGDTRRIKLKASWEESAELYVMLIGPPSSKKSPAVKAALRHVYKLQVEADKAHKEAMNRYKIRHREWEKEGKKNGEEEPTKPTEERTWTEDATVERLAGILHENPRGMLLAKDELAGWLRGMDQYKGGKGSDRQFWLSVWNNSPAAIDRKGENSSFRIPRPYVTVLGGIQPDVLPEFGKDRGDGLIERFLPCYPEPVRTRWTDDDISLRARQAFDDTVDSLYKLAFVHFDSGESIEEFPPTVDMSPEAKEVWIEAYNAALEEAEAPGFPYRLGAVWGKLEAYTARLALILAMTRIAELGARGQTNMERVEKADMEGAVTLIHYFKNHVRRTFTGLYGENQSDRLAQDLEAFLKDHGGEWEGTAKQLHEELVSDYKPGREDELSKYVRALCQRVPSLQFIELPRKADSRPFRILLKSVSLVSQEQAEFPIKASHNGADSPNGEAAAAHGQTILGVLQRKFTGNRAHPDGLEQRCIDHGMSPAQFKQGLAYLDNTGRVGYHYGETHADSFYYIPTETIK